MYRLNRRDFIKTAALPLVLPLTSIRQNQTDHGFQEKGPVIKRFSVFKSTGNFNRFIAMNAYDTAPKGINGTKSIVTILLTDGTVGIGPVGYRPADELSLKKLKNINREGSTKLLQLGIRKNIGHKKRNEGIFLRCTLCMV